MFTNMRSRSLALAAVAAVVGLGSHQALAASGAGTASATILSQISVTQTTPMAFGTIAPNSAGGSLVLSATTGTIAPVAGFVFSGSPAAGSFSVTGAVGQPVVVSYSSGDTLTGPGTAMPLGTFTNNAVPATFPAGGNFTLNVGATLTVNANQAPGPYAGNYTVTVNY
jgi:hypothetical protein